MWPREIFVSYALGTLPNAGKLPFERFSSGISLILAIVNGTVFYLLPSLFSQHLWKNLVDHVLESEGPEALFLPLYASVHLF